MLLNANSALRFIEGYKRVLLEIHRDSAEESDEDIITILAAARKKLKSNSDLLEQTASALAATGQPVEPDVLQALHSMQLGQWVYLRSTTRYAIFIDQAVENAYAVLGLTNAIEDIVGAAAVTFETAVLKFEGQYVCDGIVQNPVFLGPSYRKQFNAALANMKRNGHFHASPKP